MLKYLKNENGWAMVLVLLIIIIVPILGTTLYMYSSSAINNAQKYQDIEQARYLARSGAEAVMKVWKDNMEAGTPMDVDQEIQTVYYLPGGVFSLTNTDDTALGTVNVSIVEGSKTNSYRIISTGVIAGITQHFTISVITPITFGSDLGWYTDNTSTLLPFSNSAAKFETEGVVTIERNADLGEPEDYGFTLTQGTELELAADTIIFNNPVDVFDESYYGYSNSLRETTLKITADKIVFDDIEIGYVKGTSRSTPNELIQYSTIIVDGDVVYFKNDVAIKVLTNTFRGNGAYKGTTPSTQYIPAGSYYIGGSSDGVDLIEWSGNLTKITDVFDENYIAPSSLSA
ncbi:MAG: hypothetical protein JXQ23_05885, partial [Clostridia bacterium]|nr:hypothetical protein [Clostridia bacterium]